MVRFLKQFISSEKGQALPIVLGLLAIGGLTIATSLSYATTSLKGSQILAEDVKGVYAAGAGVEHALWYLGEYGSKPEDGELSENISQMAVDMQTAEGDTYTLYLGELVEPGVHSDYLTVEGTIVPYAGQTYKYTITVTLQHTSTIHLQEVGARIPAGYEYEEGSANADFNGNENLSTADPDDEIQDAHGGWVLNWQLAGPPYPCVSQENPVQTQSFYITGEGSQEGDYAWVVADPTAIGTVGEITGTEYRITATATRPEDGRTTAKIVADVMIGGGTIYIISWQILN